MSLKSEGLPALPEETARLAHIICPKGDLCLWIGDELSEVFQDHVFASLFPRRGQPAEAPWRLALVTVLQFVEGLSDRQAADAVRKRIDWKYALRLPLEDLGFDFSILCEFRGRLLAGGGEQLLFEALLEHAKARGWLKARGRQRTDSTHVLAAIQTLSRLECVAETLRSALNVLSATIPEWVQAQVPPEWYERYATRTDFEMLTPIQSALSERELLPKEQLVDAGYVTAEHLVTSQTQHQIDLYGPVATNPSWQAHTATGYAAADFSLDWQAQVATCPQGQQSTQWFGRADRHGREVIQIKFAAKDCATCPVRALCTHSATQPRFLMVRPEHTSRSLQAARLRQQTPAFKVEYAKRAGIEGTLSQGVRAFELRRSRYVGEKKTRLQHLMIAVALNLVRLFAWSEERPREPTRTSRFAALAPPVVLGSR